MTLDFRHKSHQGETPRELPSRLLARLEGLGLLENRGTRELGAPYAWHLTARGVEALLAGESAGSAA
jgi:hypothetical protein